MGVCNVEPMMSGTTASIVYGRMGVWAYGCMGVWVYGCMGVWVYGYECT